MNLKNNCTSLKYTKRGEITWYLYFMTQRPLLEYISTSIFALTAPTHHLIFMKSQKQIFQTDLTSVSTLMQRFIK